MKGGGEVCSGVCDRGAVRGSRRWRTDDDLSDEEVPYISHSIPGETRLKRYRQGEGVSHTGEGGAVDVVRFGQASCFDLRSCLMTHM